MDRHMNAIIFRVRRSTCATLRVLGAASLFDSATLDLSFFNASRTTAVAFSLLFFLSFAKSPNFL
jgi:hypothetical protein